MNTQNRDVFNSIYSVKDIAMEPFGSIYKTMEDPKVKEELEKHKEEFKEINDKQNEEILKSKNEIKKFYYQTK